MGKITGLEAIGDVPEKVLLLYRGVEELIAEEADMNRISVSTITDKAGIGKGTAYDYFDSREEIIACSLVFYIRKNAEEITAALLKETSFAKQIDLILDEIEKESRKRQWFFHFVHVMTDNNDISRMVRDKILQDGEGKSLPGRMFGEIIKKGRERGEIRKDVPDDYLICSMFARCMTYMLGIHMEECFPVNHARMRPLVLRGIMEEFAAEK